MSFDLFILCPRLDPSVAERFNAIRLAGLPEGLRIDPATCITDSSCILIEENGEEWGELYPEHNQWASEPNCPRSITSEWRELHFPSRGDPDVFHVAAALAEAAEGWVFDPQGAAQEADLPIGDDDDSQHAGHGFYTPAITRRIGELLASKFRWD
jgi:hypothetical protein